MKVKIILFFIFYSVSLLAKVEDCGAVKNTAIPCWRTYLRANESDESLPFYPYAKRANGCSFLNQKPGESDLFSIKNDTYNFKEACDFHDHCYYSLNSDPHTCNEVFFTKMLSACDSSGSDETRVWCYDRAKIFYNAVKLSSKIVHLYSQTLEMEYLNRVEEYIAKKPKDL